MKYKIGDIVDMKKNHPCSKDAFKWEIMRIGADIKIKCLNCGRIVMLSRYKFEKRLRK